jgi:translation initiation factor IF-1
MVRNLKGGTGTKGLARKHQSAGDNGGNIRLPTCNEEQFACVSSMLGNGMCEIFTNDNIRLIGHIRNKFRGRQKRHNTITSAMIVLVGLRSWESSPKNCDILCIYEDKQIENIKTNPNINLLHVLSLQNSLLFKTNSAESKPSCNIVDFVDDDHDDDIDTDTRANILTPNDSYIVDNSHINTNIDINDI